MNAVPGIPAGEKTAGTDYVKFLETLREILPKGKSLSIALPASFWYLKAFPVDLISPYVDYFIYMTYDLHGQWGKFRAVAHDSLRFMSFNVG